MLPLSIELGIRAFFFVLLLSAATHKLLIRDELAGTVGAYFRSFLPIGPGGARIMGSIAILVESVVALVVLSGSGQIAAMSVASLMIFYALAMGANLLVGNRNLYCGCSWQGAVPVNWSLVARNAVLAMLAAVLLIQGTDETLTLLKFLNGLAVSLGALCFYAFMEQLLQNHSLQERAAR